MTRTYETERQYADRAAELRARFLRETGACEFRALPFAEWAVSLRAGLAPATWRVYRIAARRVVEGLPFDDDALRLLDVAPAARGCRRGSALKAKRVSIADRDRLLAALALSRSTRARSLADWLRAALATGLRPCEWAVARLDGTVLLVETAKATNGRGNGGLRSLDLSRLPGEDLRAIRRMAERGAEWRETGLYETEQEAHAALLRSVVRRHYGADGSHVTLYSMRHQALANAKRQMAREEVAALAGHSSTRTAARSYGRRRSAWAPETASGAAPSPAEVATVRSPSGTYRFDMGTLRP